MKRITRFMAVLVCFAMLAMMAGCGKKPAAESAKGALEGFLEAAKSADFEKMESYTENADWDERIKDMMTIDAWKNFVTAAASRMTYEIADTKEEGKKTVFTVKFQYVDGTDAYNDAINEYYQKALSMVAEDLDEVDDEEIIAVLDETLQKKMDNIDSYMAETVLTFTSDEGEGYRLTDVGDDFVAVFSANLTTVAKDMENETVDSLDIDVNGVLSSETPAESGAPAQTEDAAASATEAAAQ